MNDMDFLATLAVAAWLGMMAGLVTITLTRRLSGGRGSASEQVTVTGESAAYANPTIPKAYTGALTTRSSGTAGTLTMTAGHNITTGARIDIFWTNVNGTLGSAYGATAGTVAVNSVPFTLAAGDALPALVGGTFAIIACVAVQAAFAVVGNDIQCVYASCQTRGRIVFEDVSAVVYTKHMTSITPLIWATGDAGANPFAGAAPISVWMSNINTTATSTDMKAEAAVN